MLVAFHLLQTGGREVLHVGDLALHHVMVTEEEEPDVVQCRVLLALLRHLHGEEQHLLRPQIGEEGTADPVQNLIKTFIFLYQRASCLPILSFLSSVFLLICNNIF